MVISYSGGEDRRCPQANSRALEGIRRISNHEIWFAASADQPEKDGQRRPTLVRLGTRAMPLLWQGPGSSRPPLGPAWPTGDGPLRFAPTLGPGRNAEWR